MDPTVADPELLRDELRAPRYTSYPTALSFHAGVGPAQYREQVAASNADPVPPPLLLYLHLPFCRSGCFYCGCHKVVSRNERRHADYCAMLMREIQLQGELFKADRPVRQIHFGGGTPNLLRPRALGRLLCSITKHFRLAEDCELSLEIDPRVAEPHDPLAWAALGFDRVSIGVQDIDIGVQKAINRVQPPVMVAALTRQLRAAGIERINYDLIYGLPRQTVSGFSRTLDFAIEQRPSRLAVFHYAHLPERLPAQRAIRPSELPSPGERQEIRALIHDRLCAAGYAAIGLDHYALPEDALAVAHRAGKLARGFQGYTPFGGCDTIGLGASAISSIGPCYAQNHSDLAAWSAAIQRDEPAICRGYLRNQEDMLRGALIEQLMCQQQIDFGVLGRRFRVSLAQYLEPDLERLRAFDPEGRLALISPTGVRVTASGRAYLRLLAQCFDPSLRGGTEAELATAV